MKKFDVVVIGTAVIDIAIRPVDKSVFDHNFNRIEKPSLLLGGCGVNQSIALSRLGSRTALATIRGNDEFGNLMMSMLAREENPIDVSAVQISPDINTGVSCAFISADGSRHFCTDRGTNAHFNLMDGFDLSVLDQTNILSIAGSFGLPPFDGEEAGKLCLEAQRRGVVTVMDTFTDIYGLGWERAKHMFCAQDYLFPSYDEISDLTGEKDVSRIADVLLDCGAKHVGIKLGAEGCYFKDADQEFRVPAMKGNIIDTTGAGDNFMAGFITGLIRGYDAEACCRLGCAAGFAASCSLGANTGVKSYEQLEQIIKGGEES
ncbi:MAG: sugar kinase [Lachnospiraceae bacterium]|nr:sugar kinase [Lachnospiraceae bacterium]